MDKEQELIVLRNFSDPMTAQLIKAILEDHGVPAMLKDIHFNFPGSFFNSQTSGIKLLVRRMDSEEAEQILNKNETAGDQVDEED